MTQPNQQPPKTQIGQMVTQAINTMVSFGQQTLKPDARVPEIHVEGHTKPYPLVGDRHTGGRSRKNDIPIKNDTVSATHFSLSKDPNHPRHYIIQDEKSSNGLYINKRKTRSYPLRNGDVVYLAPPELAQAIKLTYRYKPPIWVQLIRYGLMGTGGFIGFICLLLAWQWSKFPLNPLPAGVTGPVVIFANDGETAINPVTTDSHREIQRLKDFSPYLRQGVLASEDARFYWHVGVDPIGIARAVKVALSKGNVSQGASTITQQVARSLFPAVGTEKTASRKLREMIVALKMETFFSKNEILSLYLNKVYLGVGQSGFEDAAQFYFDKSARNIDLVESATLIAMLPAPNAFNPIVNPEKSREQRNLVIDRMHKLGMITDQEQRQAKLTPIEDRLSEDARRALSNNAAPYFYSYVQQELTELLGEDALKMGNLYIETGLDLQMQRTAAKALEDSIDTDGAKVGYSQGAIATLNSDTGELLAMVGGKNYAESQFNRAVQAKRQPGSTFKVFGYGAAIAEGISPFTSFSCSPLNWQGQQYRGCERTSTGTTDMFRGIAQSENAIALRVAKEVGLKNVISFAQQLGIESDLNAAPGLVLGESEVTVLEMSGAYATFANGGTWHKPHAIRKIYDSSDCKGATIDSCYLLYDFSKRSDFRREQVISQSTAQTMTQMMQGVIQSGTAKVARLGLDEAGKTGTTNRNVDMWFVGYVPSQKLVTAVWLGNDDNTPTQGSSYYAAKLWGAYTNASF
ncbi:FHA modulated glycosyl transferase/transpeptidase [[Leptolyngbya] sp. PCC 7376]|uniref:PBP1A family penicillin-binding protein n=1 Tax=[Leptolyngbya] sp. PCC 7376 TaxID=111781 RepID=UPI00029EDD5B|nr:PBP1A family penicillin-binding protein [[Leptolyngbya] sp. PCC 7376]AFY39219.1 FHA modulated glycosyl transferase/transpeptidase [[Leptolyngbya] sp. PCC 7376]